MCTGILASVAALLVLSAAKTQGGIIATAGISNTDAVTLCSLSQTLKQLARQVQREMEEAHTRHENIAAACSHAIGVEAQLAAARGTNETQRLTLIGTQLCARVGAVSATTRRVSITAAKLSRHNAALAGGIGQWLNTMGSVVSKADSGKFCLGSSAAATEGGSTLATTLVGAMKGKTERYNNDDQSATTVPPNTCGAPLNKTATREEEQNTVSRAAVLEARQATQLSVTASGIGSVDVPAHEHRARQQRRHLPKSQSGRDVGQHRHKLEHARRHIQQEHNGHHQGTHKRTRQRQRRQMSRGMESSVDHCRQGLVHGRGRAG
ncbi:putative Trypanosome variant surface glycoprotein (A type) [Trypanosoma vivax]|nr:putative Trypanosome variant surface glycoprotein (A type) [Trypanosoma vivax]